MEWSQLCDNGARSSCRGFLILGQGQQLGGEWSDHYIEASTLPLLSTYFIAPLHQKE